MSRMLSFGGGGGALSLDGGTITLDRGTRPPYTLRTGVSTVLHKFCWPFYSTGWVAPKKTKPTNI